GQLERGAEVDGARAVGRGELFGRALFEDLSGGEDVRPITDGERVADVVVGEEDAEATLFELSDLALQLVDVDRVDAGERLVEEHEARGGEQRAGDLGAAPLAS